MQHKKNQFKSALVSGECQIGLWVGGANPYTTEICAGVGYDWLLLDGEHAPNTLTTILSQLQVIAGYASAPVVRPAWNDMVFLKQLLDIGAQNFLIPMIQSASEAEKAVAALYYPPQGVRGVGTALARAAQWGAVTNYLERANDEVCLLCQVETVEAMSAIEDICAVDGVDGVFIGPADLAASMGYLGEPGNPKVVAAIEQGIDKIVASGKAAGILQADIQSAKRYIERGARFVAVGVDTVLLRRGCIDVLSQFKQTVQQELVQKHSAY